MNSFDKVDNAENLIEQELSKIKVDNENLKVNTLKNLYNKSEKRRKILMRKKLLVSAAFIILIIGGVYAIKWGGFEWLNEKLNPNFINVVDVIEQNSEDKDIQLDIIGAKKYDNNAIIYLSLKDKSTKKRLTEKTNFLDGFYVKQKEKENEIQGFSMKTKLLYFDEKKNTAFFEISLASDFYSPISEPLEIGSKIIVFDEKEYSGKYKLDKINNKKGISISDEKILGGSSKIGMQEKSRYEILKTDTHSKFNSEVDDLWISSMGFINGELHIQTAKLWNKEFGSTDPSIQIENKEKKIIDPEYSIIFLGDEKNIAKGDDKNAKYKYEEFVFKIDENQLEDCSLKYNFKTLFGVEGEWSVVSSLNENSDKIRLITDEIKLPNQTIKRIALSPLGVDIQGSTSLKNFNGNNIILTFEVEEDIIQIDSWGGRYENGKFQYNWNSDKPIDVSKINYLNINGIKIDLNK